jgi:hypothetical protein
MMTKLGPYDFDLSAWIAIAIHGVLGDALISKSSLYQSSQLSDE